MPMLLIGSFGMTSCGKLGRCSEVVGITWMLILDSRRRMQDFA
jgi:hypothetical protein